MDINQLNKKRKTLVIISLIVTITLLIVFVFTELIFINFAQGLFKLSAICLDVIVFFALLYVFSKFIIIPQYNKIKLNITKDIFEKKYAGCRISNYPINKDIYYLYNKNNLTIKNSYQLCTNDNYFSFYDFEFATKTGLRSTKIDFKGKYLSFRLNGPEIADCAYIMQNKNKSEDFIKFFEKKYEKKNNDITIGKKYYRYICLYNDKFDYDICKLIDEIREFACMIIKDNVITIYFHENVDGFDFKLKDKVEQNIFFQCKESYTTLFNIINKAQIEMGKRNEK